jgi:hypothetical protein
LVDHQPGHAAHNVVIDIADPVAGAALAHPIVSRVEAFLQKRGKSVSCIANTIFPQALYQRYGMPDFIEAFHNRVLPKVRTNKRWSGYYFERLTNYPNGDKEPIDQLTRMIERLNDPANTSNNKHEVTLFDPTRDVTGSPYGGQCLSFLSFHLLPGTPKTLTLTAQYRNHYYIEKLLGNLIGLGRLMAFIASEAELSVGALTVISTHAEIDLPGATRKDFVELLDGCSQTQAPSEAAA